jgi:hypothetical protein
MAPSIMNLVQPKDDQESTVVPQRNPHAALPIDYNFDIIGGGDDDGDGDVSLLTVPRSPMNQGASFSPPPPPPKQQQVQSVVIDNNNSHVASQHRGLVDEDEEFDVVVSNDDFQQQQHQGEDNGLIDLGDDEQSWLANMQGSVGDDEEQQQQAMMTEEELQAEYKRKREEKSRLMAEYRMLRDMGYVGSDEPELTHSTSMDELTRVVERLRAQHELDESIKWQRQMLIMFTNTVEDVLEPNSKLNIFGLKLQGWSESVFNKIHDFDRIFEQLHHKYKSQYTSMPEIQLAKALLTSAYFYHTSQKLAQKRSASSSPHQQQFEEVMRQNPHLRQQYEATLRHMGSASMPGATSGGERVVSDILHEQRAPVAMPAVHPHQQQQHPVMSGPSTNVIDEIMAMPTTSVHPMSNDGHGDDDEDGSEFYAEDILDLSEEDEL